MQGTNGIWEKDNRSVYIENLSKTEHSWESEKEYLKEYDHYLWKKFENQASGSGHGGMDFFVLRDFINSVKNGTNPPLDVYDAASMSVISPLSENLFAREVQQ